MLLAVEHVSTRWSLGEAKLSRNAKPSQSRLFHICQRCSSRVFAIQKWGGASALASAAGKLFMQVYINFFARHRILPIAMTARLPLPVPLNRTVVRTQRPISMSGWRRSATSGTQHARSVNPWWPSDREHRHWRPALGSSTKWEPPAAVNV